MSHRRVSNARLDKDPGSEVRARQRDLSPETPQDRDGRLSTELFEGYRRSEQALVATLAEMYQA